jgi:hypothetical protein
MNAISTKAALADLRSTTCACGKGKMAGKSHCRPCYFSLHAVMRKALYLPLRKGYEEAYAASLSYLELKSPAAQAEADSQNQPQSNN